MVSDGSVPFSASPNKQCKRSFKIVVVMSSTCFHLKWIVPCQKFSVLWHLSKQQIQCNLAKRPKYVETENSGEAIRFLYCFFLSLQFWQIWVLITYRWYIFILSYLYMYHILFWATFECTSCFCPSFIIMNYKAKEHHHYTESIAKQSERWKQSTTENMLKRAKQLFMLKFLTFNSKYLICFNIFSTALWAML